MIAYFRSSLSACLLALALAGCGSTVTMVEPTIPPPNTEKIHVDVALRIPEEFNQFIHEENVLGKQSWTINLGSANAMFFTQLFGYLFDNVTIIGPDDDARDYTFDALIEPSIDGFEFSVPNQSKTEAFAVWVRYRLRIFDREGNNASNWTVSAYGKSMKEGMGGSTSLQRAAVLAMRDAAALIIMQLDKATKISKLADGPVEKPIIQAAAVSEGVESDQVAENDENDLGIFVIGGIDDEAE